MTQVNQMGKFNENYDVKNAVNFLHPQLIKYLGGKQNAIKNFTNSFAEYKKQGFIFEKYNYEPPIKIIKYKGELQAAVIQKIVVRTKNGKLLEENTMIAISNDNGKVWKFVGTTKENRNLLKKVFPNLSPDLKIINKDLVPVE
ncbi:hypothetical protein [Halpernia sp. GG3]